MESGSANFVTEAGVSVCSMGFVCVLQSFLWGCWYFEVTIEDESYWIIRIFSDKPLEMVFSRLLRLAHIEFGIDFEIDCGDSRFQRGNSATLCPPKRGESSIHKQKWLLLFFSQP
jgi:hypothetical protein